MHTQEKPFNLCVYPPIMPHGLFVKGTFPERFLVKNKECASG